MKKLQNSSKTHFFSYCLSFRRWPAKSEAAGGVININLLFLYRISISKNFFMMLRQVFWICYRFREPPPCFPGNRGGFRLKGNLFLQCFKAEDFYAIQRAKFLAPNSKKRTSISDFFVDIISNKKRFIIILG